MSLDLRLARSRSSAGRRLGIGAAFGFFLVLAAVQGAVLAQPSFSEVAPIFQQRCTLWRSGVNAPLGLRLDSDDGLMAGSVNGPVVVPGAPESSELLRRIVGQALPRMPFDGPPFLDEEQIWLIQEWIAQGAMDSQGREAPDPIGGELRLHGILTARWELDGLPLVVTSSTRIDGEVVPGAYVEVRGVLGPAGEVLVERIRER